MALKIGEQLPSLDGAAGWLGCAPTDLRDRPALVHFWSVSCPVCKANLPTLRQWRTAYPKVQFVAIHMPRFETELDIAAITQTAAELGLDEPCAIDNHHTLGNRFQTNGTWPYYFLFDADGRLMRRAFGLNGIQFLRGSLERLFQG